MSKIKKIFLTIGILFLIAIISFFLYMKFLFPYHFESPKKTVLKNSKSGGEAVLFTHGALMGHRISFFVKDNNNDIWIGNIETDDSGFQSICWSMDGSVIASKSSSRYTDRPIFTHAYDFTNNKLYQPGKNGFNKKADWVKLSKQIKDLLESRGGMDKEIEKESLHNTNSKASYSEWENYQKLEKAN